MKGWKTFVSGLVLIGTGAYLLAIGNIEQGIALIGQGGAIIGIGHKLDKANN